MKLLTSRNKDSTATADAAAAVPAQVEEVSGRGTRLVSDSIRTNRMWCSSTSVMALDCHSGRHHPARNRYCCTVPSEPSKPINPSLIHPLICPKFIHQFRRIFDLSNWTGERIQSKSDLGKRIKVSRISNGRKWVVVDVTIRMLQAIGRKHQ